MLSYVSLRSGKFLLSYTSRDIPQPFWVSTIYDNTPYENVVWLKREWWM